MGDKTFSGKVREHAADFAQIYEDFWANYKRSCKAREDSNTDSDLSGDPWRYLFEAPILKRSELSLPHKPATHSDTRDSIAGLFMDPLLQAAVIETAKRLGLADQRVGGIETNDPRIGLAIDLGMLTYDDLEPLYRIPKAKQLAHGKYYVTRHLADGTDPFVWRTLLEVLCRTFLALPGPRQWPAKRTLQLGFDLLKINAEFKKEGKRFSIDKAYKKLNSERGSYKTKYPDGVGRERIEKLLKDVGPMNKDFFRGLKRAFGKEFSEEFDRFLRPRPKTLKEIEQALQQAGQIFSGPMPGNSSL
ncbi:hypothetical protein ACQR0V_12220 [Bradyrhizobium sp. HKCCYLS2058]|uniref:hypothetical protein n=1 Tax=unclassified Bradyrhizobium TaxID=2631580 RepID=UPI003EBB9332